MGRGVVWVGREVGLRLVECMIGWGRVVMGQRCGGGLEGVGCGRRE